MNDEPLNADLDPQKEITKYPWECLNLRFDKPLIDPEKTSPRYNVYAYRGKASCVVKLTLSGVQQVLGYFDNLEIASRYADMATLKFHKFIKRPRFNFSEAQAKTDDENDGYEITDTDKSPGFAHFILTRIFNEYNQAGKLVEVSGQLKPETGKRGRKLAEYLQFVKRLSVTVEQLQSEVRTLKQKVATLEGRVTAITPEPPIDGAQPAPTPLTVWCPTNQPTNQPTNNEQ